MCSSVGAVCNCTPYLERLRAYQVTCVSEYTYVPLKCRWLAVGTKLKHEPMPGVNKELNYGVVVDVE